MRRRKPSAIKISRADQQELKRLLRDGRTQQRVVRRAQVLLTMKNPKTVVERWKVEKLYLSIYVKSD